MNLSSATQESDPSLPKKYQHIALIKTLNERIAFMISTRIDHFYVGKKHSEQTTEGFAPTPSKSI